LLIQDTIRLKHESKMCAQIGLTHDSVVDCVLPMGLVVKRAQSMTVW